MRVEPHPVTKRFNWEGLPFTIDTTNFKGFGYANDFTEDTFGLYDLEVEEIDTGTLIQTALTEKTATYAIYIIKIDDTSVADVQIALSNGRMRAKAESTEYISKYKILRFTPATHPIPE